MADKPRFEISATQVVGGALAAAGAATAASLLGVYGTVIGSAVMSVIATVGAALYGHSVERGKQTIERVRYHRTTGKMQRLNGDGVPVQEDRESTTDPENEITQDLSDTPTEQLAADESAGGSADTADTEAETAGPSLGERLRALNWRTVSVTAAVVLVLGLGTVTLAELAMGQSMSSALGGGDGGKHNVSVVRAFTGGGATGGRGHPHTSGPSATSSDASPTASTSSAEESPTSAPDTTTETATTQSTEEPTTTEPTTAPTTAPPSTSEPTQGGDTSRGLAPNQRATGGGQKR